MLTKFNFYEGVPVGPDNFNNFFTAVMKNSDAVLTLAFGDGTIDYNGGHLATKSVEYRVLETTNGNFYVLSAKDAILDEIINPDGSASGIFSPSKSKGIIFSKSNDRYFSEEIPYIRTSTVPFGYTGDLRYKACEDVPVLEWQTVGTGYNQADFVATGNFVYRKNIPTAPYRLIKEVSGGDFINYTYKIDTGVMDLRYNGVPQTGTNSNDLRFYTAAQASKDRYESKSGYIYDVGGNKVTLNTLTLGAEYPHPLYLGKYKFGTVEGQILSDWKANFGDSSGYINLLFPYSNFGSFSAHIILRREADDYLEGGGIISTVETPSYVYVKEDSTSGTSVREGCFKIMDRGRGIIRLNLSTTTLAGLSKNTLDVPDAIRFSILSPEQLLESKGDDGIRRFKSRYGKVFTGSYIDTELVTVFYDYKTTGFEVNRITEGISSDTNTDVLYIDRNANIKNIVLAIKYPGATIFDADSQKNKYIPDILSMFYIPVTPYTPDISQIEGFVEINQTSWYNQDVINREYKPVSRADVTFVGLKKKGMYTNVLSFDPTTAIFRFNSGPSANYYVHKDKTGLVENLGRIDEYVRRDGALAEPHYINPPIVKTFLVNGERLDVLPKYQLAVDVQYVLEGNSKLYIDGQFIIR